MKARLNEEAENLHKYYNDKLHEKLEDVSVKVLNAEKDMLNAHAKQLSNLEKTTNDRIADAELKFQIENESLKKKYESEVANLKRENLDKGRLIGAVSRQLQSFESGSRVLDISNSNFEVPVPQPPKPQPTRTKSKSHGHGQGSGQSKSSKVILPIQQATPVNQPHSAVVIHSTVAMAQAQHFPNPSFDTASVEVKNCIATLVNAYKEKNWPSHQNQS